MFFNLFDSHTHSTLSPDGEDATRDMAQAALDAGLSGISMTNHCDLDEFAEKDYPILVEKAVGEVHTVREAFHGRIDVSFGIEVGQQYLDPAWWRATVERNHYDFIIGSVHRVKDWPDLYTVDYAWMDEKTLDAVMHCYWNDVDVLVEQGDFDVLGHMSYPLRSAMKNSGIGIDLKRYTDRIDHVLRTLIHAGRGIEINTSGLRGPLRDTMPPLWVVRRYRQLGGEIITLGSDAHRVGEVGCGLQKGMAMLEAAGFAYFAFYRQRRPVMLRVL